MGRYSKLYSRQQGSLITSKVRKQHRQQDYGLVLEKRDDGRVYVIDIALNGILFRQQIPILVDDEIVQINDRNLCDDFETIEEIQEYIQHELILDIVSIRRNEDSHMYSPPASPRLSSPKSRRDKKKKPILVIQSGSLMKLQNIVAKPELNGKVVEILGKANATTNNSSSNSNNSRNDINNNNMMQERWEVLVLQTKSKLSVPAEKLTYLEVERDYKIKVGDLLMLQDIQAKPELNGESVKVLGEADTPGRWKVQVIPYMGSSGSSSSQRNLNNNSDAIIVSVTPDKLVKEEEFWKNSWRKSGWDV